MASNIEGTPSKILALANEFSAAVRSDLTWRCFAKKLREITVTIKDPEESADIAQFIREVFVDGFSGSPEIVLRRDVPQHVLAWFDINFPVPQTA